MPFLLPARHNLHSAAVAAPIRLVAGNFLALVGCNNQTNQMGIMQLYNRYWLVLLVVCIGLHTTAQTVKPPVPYGNHPAAGRYVHVGDARLYYELYGKGKPLVLLHGGVYGYIDEFEYFIPRLAEQYQVICIATRGHGKSEIGSVPYSYQQWAEDAYQVIRSITKDSVTVLGFSDGGNTGLTMAALYPELVNRLVAIGVGYREKRDSGSFRYSAAALLKSDSAFFTRRIRLMPAPARWEESLTKLNRVYSNDVVGKERLGKIKCPVLIMSGDRDAYHTTEAVVQCAQAIPGAQLSIIPGCSHVVFYCNFPAVWEALRPFLKIK